MKEVYGLTVNKYMCSPLCPCDTADQAAWATVTKAQLYDNSRNRVATYAELTAAKKTALNNNQGYDGDANSAKPGGAKAWDLDKATAIPLVWAAVPAGGAKNTVAADVWDNFESCYNLKLKTLWTGETAEASNAAAAGGAAETPAELGKSTFNSDGFAFFSAIEKDLKCSGACWKPVFGIERTMS